MDVNKDDRVMSLLDSFLEERGENMTEGIDPASAPSDYISAYLDSPSTVDESAADKAIRTKTEQLLDAFLASGFERMTPDSAPLKESDVQVSDGIDDETNVLEDSYYTETLARIYLKQRRYDKALEIIRSLYLNFPNKSIYFADQIRYLEKIVWINQNSK